MDRSDNIILGIACFVILLGVHIILSEISSLYDSKQFITINYNRLTASIAFFSYQFATIDYIEFSIETTQKFKILTKITKKNLNNEYSSIVPFCYDISELSRQQPLPPNKKQMLFFINIITVGICLGTLIIKEEPNEFYNIAYTLFAFALFFIFSVKKKNINNQLNKAQEEVFRSIEQKFLYQTMQRDRQVG